MLEKYDHYDYDSIYNLIMKINKYSLLLELKLIVNIKFNKNKDLLDLIDSKLIMLKLV